MDTVARPALLRAGLADRLPRAADKLFDRDHADPRCEQGDRQDGRPDPR